MLMFNHFNNLASEKYFAETKDSILIRTNVTYNLNKLYLMDQMVAHKDLKNNLLKYATRNFLSYNNSDADCDAMYKSYQSKSTSEEHSEYITSLYNTIKKLRPGNKFPDVEVINYKNEVTNINSLFDKPTVVYFWSHAIKNHFKNSHLKVADLKIKYPNINFVSININADKLTIWKRLLYQNNFPLESEYRFRDADAAKKILAIHYINKVLVVDRNNMIITSNANMFSGDFKELLDFLYIKKPR
jgi:peroxiredoxin